MCSVVRRAGASLFAAAFVALCGCETAKDYYSDYLGEKTAVGEDRFEGDLSLQPIGEGKMELLQAYAYVDKAGRRWEAPKGYLTNGASIPRPLWTVVGSPFAGDYLHAAVVHDVFCEARHRKEETWQQVHRMFYDACVRAGVDAKQAKQLYAGVYFFGPRWPDVNSPDEPKSLLDKHVIQRLKSTGAFQRLAGATKLAPKDDQGMYYNRELGVIVPTSSEDKSLSQSETAELIKLQQELLKRCGKWIDSDDPSLEQIEKWNFETESVPGDTKEPSAA